MGRTIPTFRRVMDVLEAEWSDYAAVLRGREREAFARLWSQARRHAAAATNQAPLEPLDAVVFGVLLEHELRLVRLEAVLVEAGLLDEARPSTLAVSERRGEGTDEEAAPEGAQGEEETGRNAAADGEDPDAPPP